MPLTRAGDRRVFRRFQAQNSRLHEGWLKESDSTERRSLYRLLPRLSGAKEQEQLTPQEKENLCL